MVVYLPVPLKQFHYQRAAAVLAHTGCANDQLAGGWPVDHSRIRVVKIRGKGVYGDNGTVLKRDR